MFAKTLPFFSYFLFSHWKMIETNVYLLRFSSELILSFFSRNCILLLLDEKKIVSLQESLQENYVRKLC